MPDNVHQSAKADVSQNMDDRFRRVPTQSEQSGSRGPTLEPRAASVGRRFSSHDKLHRVYESYDEYMPLKPFSDTSFLTHCNSRKSFCVLPLILAPGSVVSIAQAACRWKSSRVALRNNGPVAVPPQHEPPWSRRLRKPSGGPRNRDLAGDERH